MKITKKHRDVLATKNLTIVYKKLVELIPYVSNP